MEGQGRIAEALEKLSPREKKLLGLWAVSMAFIVIMLGSWLAWSSIEEKALKAEEYQNTLQLIAKRQGEYLSNKGSGSKPVEQRMAENKIKLQTFLDREATRYNLKIKNFKESSAPLSGKSKGGGPVEESITIDVDEADFNDLSRFLDSLAKSKELIVIKRVDIERARRFNESGKVKMTMTVSTFKQGTT